MNQVRVANCISSPLWQRRDYPAFPFVRVQPTPPQSIVVVDDEKSYTELLTQILSQHLDCPVHAFARPVEALKALPTLNPGVVVTDYFMPDLNGLEFIRQGAEVAPHASFVLISGHNLIAEKSQMARLPALKGFLPKPFGWMKLIEEILRVWPPNTTPPTRRV
ncbi:MAG: response regulator [Opitutaceae bacterium]